MEPLSTSSRKIPARLQRRSRTLKTSPPPESSRRRGTRRASERDAAHLPGLRARVDLGSRRTSLAPLSNLSYGHVAAVWEGGRADARGGGARATRVGGAEGAGGGSTPSPAERLAGGLGRV